MDALAADAVAALHLPTIAFLLTGGLLALRAGRLLYAHAPVALAILAVNLAGADCPLTDLEVALRERAGEPAYAGGFIEHYLVEPVYPEGITDGVQWIIYGLAIVPNLLAYTLLLLARPQPVPRGRGLT